MCEELSEQRIRQINQTINMLAEHKQRLRALLQEDLQYLNHVNTTAPGRHVSGQKAASYQVFSPDLTEISGSTTTVLQKPTSPLEKQVRVQRITITAVVLTGCVLVAPKAARMGDQLRELAGRWLSR